MPRNKRHTRTVHAQVTRQDGMPLDSADIGAVTVAAFEDHSARHENGGADEISVAGLSGLLADPQTPLVHSIITGHNGFPGGTTDFLRADGAFAAPPAGTGLTQPQVLARVSMRG